MNQQEARTQRPDCQDPQCKQVHEILNALLAKFGIMAAEHQVSAGKALIVASEINKLEKERDALLEEIEGCREAKTRAQAERDALQKKLAALPGDWQSDSSLETWFPMTAEHVKKLEEENRRLQLNATVLQNEADISKEQHTFYRDRVGQYVSAEREWIRINRSLKSELDMLRLRITHPVTGPTEEQLRTERARLRIFAQECVLLIQNSIAYCTCGDSVTHHHRLCPWLRKKQLLEHWAAVPSLHPDPAQSVQGINPIDSKP